MVQMKKTEDLITPFYMGYPREAVVELLLPAFLPINLIKGGLNAGITMLLYKPIVPPYIIVCFRWHYKKVMGTYQQLFLFTGKLVTEL